LFPILKRDEKTDGNDNLGSFTDFCITHPFNPILKRDEKTDGNDNLGSFTDFCITHPFNPRMGEKRDAHPTARKPSPCSSPRI